MIFLDLLGRFKKAVKYERLKPSWSSQVDLPQRLNRVMPVNPRMGISYSNSSTSTMRYYPLVSFKQHLCECISLWNPLDYFNSRTLARGWPVAPVICIAVENKVLYPSCATGAELNSNFRNSQQPQAGVAKAVLWIDTSLQNSSLSPS